VKNLLPFPKRTCRCFSLSSTFQPLFSYEYIRKQWLGGGEGFDIAARGGGGGAVARTSSGATGSNQTLGGKGGRGGRKQKKTSGAEAAKGEGAAFKFRPARQAREDSALEDEPNKAEQQQQQVSPHLCTQNLNLHDKNPTQVAAEAAQRQLLESEMTRVLHGRIVLSTALGRYQADALLSLLGCFRFDSLAADAPPLEEKLSLSLKNCFTTSSPRRFAGQLVQPSALK
jgi:hypothetical protein